MKARDISGLEQTLGHRFARRELLERALTHTSHAHEERVRTGAEGDGLLVHNQQLEFLGDVVLSLITSEELLRRFPAFQEGELSKLRAHLVSEKHLIEAARSLELGAYLHLGRGEDKSGGRSKPALLVDALEAVLGALYLDAGLGAPRAFVLRHILEPELVRLEEAEAEAGALPLTDYKSTLQEKVHALGRPQPDYVLIREEGPEHQKTFTVEARLHAAGPRSAPEHVSRGTGSTKKKAEQAAARLALQYLAAQAGPEEGAAGAPAAPHHARSRAGVTR